MHRNYITYLLFIGVGLAMLVLTWGRWADATVDFGRELYIPYRLTTGEVLYRDIGYVNGPFSPYFNALVFRVFGVSFRTLVLTNLLLIALLLSLLYSVFKRLEGETAGRLAGLSFLLIFAFGRITEVGNYNFVTPYSHELLHGMVLLILEIWALGQYENKRQSFWFLLAGFSTGLCFLTKPEIFVSSASAFSVAWAILLWKQQSPGIKIAAAAIMFVCAPVFAAWFLLRSPLGGSEAYHALLFQWQAATDSQILGLDFYRKIFGADRLASNLLNILVMAFVWAFILSIPLWLKKLHFSITNSHFYIFFSAAVSFIVGLTSFPDIIRPLPLAVLGIGIVWFRKPGKCVILKAATLTAAIMLLAKILVNAHFFHYGFALAMLAALSVFAASLSSLPNYLAGRYRFAGLFPHTALGMWIALIAVHVLISSLTLSRIHYAVGHDGDRFLADERGPLIQAALDYLDKNRDSSLTLAVLPEGVMLNYLARLRNPTPYINFMPPEIILFGEKRILKAFNDSPPDIIALVDKDTSEYGFPVFGKDYAYHLSKWVRDNYDECALFGPHPLKGQGFGILLLRRRPATQNLSSD
jgi:hypothetical protein